MSHIRIKGKPYIRGEVSISGSKNAVLPIAISCLLSEEPLHLKNVPNLKDVHNLLDILSEIGVDVYYDANNHYLSLHKIKETKTVLLEENSKHFRASVLILGPMLSKFGHVKINSPGGCSIGTRPIDLHISGLEQLGAKISHNNSVIEGSANGLIGTEIKLKFPSVGATENLIMASTLANGRTTIYNFAREPEIYDLIICLNGMGAKITVDDEAIVIEGVKSLHEHTHEIILDRVELGSYILAGSINQGEIFIKNANLKMIQTELSVFKSIGISIVEENEIIHVKGPEHYTAVDFETKVYPGFSTDLQSQLVTILCAAEGVSIATENIFENRFLIVPELIKLKCDVKIEERTATITGVSKMVGTRLKSCSDLRGTFSLIMAAMLSEGESQIFEFESINRGYENWLGKLQNIGVDIEIIE